MATWLDGPEYAPTERPDEFVAPKTAVALAEPTTAPSPSPPDPGSPPALAPPSSAIDLAQLIPDLRPARDAAVPFEISRSFNVATQNRLPTEPFATAREVTDPALEPDLPPQPPTPGYRPPAAWPTPQVNPPAFAAPPPHPEQQESSQKPALDTSWLLVILAIGVLLPALAIPAFFTAFLLATRTKKLPPLVFTGFAIGALFTVLSFLGPILTYPLSVSLSEGWDSATTTANLFCIAQALFVLISGLFGARPGSKR